MPIRISVLAAGATGALTAASALMTTGAAAADPFNVACVKGDDERSIEILAPGSVGAACDVEYEQGGVARTPYHANNSRSFCDQKAAEIVDNLISSGFACGQVGGALTAEARPAPAELREPEPAQIQTGSQVQTVPETKTAAAPSTAPAPVVEAETPAQPEVSVQPEATVQPETVLPDTLPEIQSDSVAVTAAEPEPEAEPVQERLAEPAPDIDSLVGAAPIEEPFSAQVAEASVETVEAAASPAEAPSSLLNEPDTSVATRGPAALAGERLEVLESASEPIPAGRLVGAAPTPRKVVSPPEAAQPAPEPTVKLAAAPAEPKQMRSAASRAPEDIVMATLEAQTAAWNEGNLAAYMAFYWNDADLKFVSGTSVIKGWTNTMKRYRERYGNETGLGHLSTDKNDVELITDDVAVVTGRYTLVKNEETAGGAYTLVMKRIDGVWRIVHDHTVGDLPRTE